VTASAVRGSPSSGDSLEPALARVLQVGTYVSIALVAVGSALLLASGTSPLAVGPPLAIDRLAGDIFAARPSGFLWLGILGIVATPGVRVVGALLGFWRRGERAMVAVAVLILAVVAVGVVVGLLAG
jgi:uncharacterized membrane protein